MARAAFRMSILAAALAALGASAATDTGQGIMVRMTAPTNIMLVQNQIYNYNEATAASFFTNAWDGNAPTVTCTGPGCSTPPAAPAAPPADPSKVSQQLLQKNRCNFWSGLPLEGTTYTRNATIQTGSGRSGATYTYAFTYVVSAPLEPPQTAWDLLQETGDGTAAPVTVDADIAGESAMVSNRFRTPKYSFSLNYTYTDPVTLLPVQGNRVTDLVVTLDQGTASEVAVATTSALVYPIDFAYQTNAGTNGNTALLKDGDARTILNTDSHDGNNDGGADGSALALALMQPVAFTVPVGDHTITLTGTVKDNTASLTSTSFSVGQTVHVHAEQCTAQ